MCCLSSNLTGFSIKEIDLSFVFALFDALVNTSVTYGLLPLPTGGPKVSVVFAFVAVVSALSVKQVALLIAATVALEGMPVPVTVIPTTNFAVESIVMCLTLVDEPSDKPDV
jgi:hypothetical protein